MDKKSIIGFVLIGIILFGYSWYQGEQTEKAREAYFAAQREQFVLDSIDRAEHPEKYLAEVAEQIASYPEVESVSLMSGACDLSVVVKGKTFLEVSSFVAKELAFIDGVTSTATQFIMRKYKEYGVELTRSEDDGRSKILL